MDRYTRGQWFRSSRCEAGNCVEVSWLADDTVAMRDSKVDGGPLLHFTVVAWRDFLDGLRAGDLASK